MRAIWTIAGREVKTFFDSLMAYILIVLFLAICGLFTWIFFRDVFLVKQATLDPFFYSAYFTLFVIIPAITMKMLAEENRSGTIELLLTKAVTDWQVIIGKFLACLILVLIMLLFTLPYYFSISYIGPADHGAILTGYFGLILLSIAYIGVGLFASSITNNQIVAFLLTLAFGAVFVVILWLYVVVMGGNIANFLNYFSFFDHFESLYRGVIDSRDVIFFLSVGFLGLLFAEIALAKRNLVD